jgi:hypothetical protein
MVKSCSCTEVRPAGEVIPTPRYTNPLRPCNYSSPAPVCEACHAGAQLVCFACCCESQVTDFLTSSSSIASSPCLNRLPHFCKPFHYLSKSSYLLHGGSVRTVNAEARVWVQESHWGICGGQSDTNTIKAEAIPLHTMKALGGEKVQLLLILCLRTRWGWVVSVTPRPRFSPGKDLL